MNRPVCHGRPSADAGRILHKDRITGPAFRGNGSGSEEHYADPYLFHHLSDMEHDMIRLQLSLAFLLTSTLAYAQNQTAGATPPGVATDGDGWLWLLVIPFIAVAVGVYLFIKRGRAAR